MPISRRQDAGVVGRSGAAAVRGGSGALACEAVRGCWRGTRTSWVQGPRGIWDTLKQDQGAKCRGMFWGVPEWRRGSSEPGHGTGCLGSVGCCRAGLGHKVWGTQGALGQGQENGML